MILGKHLYKVGHPFIEDRNIEQLLWTQRWKQEIFKLETEVKVLN